MMKTPKQSLTRCLPIPISDSILRLIKTAIGFCLWSLAGSIDESMESIYEQFAFKIKMALSRYFKDYNYTQSYEDLKAINNPTSLMEYFFETVKEDSIYLLIDEYDHFANAILAYSMEDFLKIVGKGGFVRSFYEVLKTATQIGTIQKMFITGVTPITLDSLSSGFNIVTPIARDGVYRGVNLLRVSNPKHVSNP